MGVLIRVRAVWTQAARFRHGAHALTADHTTVTKTLPRCMYIASTPKVRFSTVLSHCLEPWCLTISSAQYGVMPNPLFDVFEAQFQLNCLTIVGLALVVYDHCLTFSLEVCSSSPTLDFHLHMLTFIGGIFLVRTLVAFASALSSGKPSRRSVDVFNHTWYFAVQSRYLPLLVLLYVTSPLLCLLRIDVITCQFECHRCVFSDCYC